MKNGKELVHHYFGKQMGWKVEKGDPEQYLNVNFRADWVGTAIDAHVEQHVAARIKVASKAAEEMIELLQQHVLEQDDTIARLGKRVQELEKELLEIKGGATSGIHTTADLRRVIDRVNAADLRRAIDEADNPFHVKAPT